MANQITHKKTTFKVGNKVKIHQKIQEGDNTRTQIFEGIVIAIKKHDDPTFTVRKIASGGIGVEKIFPLNSPVISKVEVTKESEAKRAKLYYLRQRSGKKATKIKERKKKKA